MRMIFALALLPVPAFAWEFSYDGICRLSQTTSQAELLITYDPGIPEYALSIFLANGKWPDATSFEMTFIGPRAGSIGTTQQSLALDGKALGVRDQGFDNVLDGLEFNDTVLSNSGVTSVTFSLNSAPPAVRAFRACPSDTPATS